MPPTLRRYLPATLVLLLVVISWSARSGRDVARAMPPPPPMSCSSWAQQGSSADFTQGLLQTGDKLFQPIGTTTNILACSLRVQTTYRTLVQVNLEYFDPVTLAPDPTTVALRSGAFQLSTNATSSFVRFVFNPPVVVRPVTGIAEPASHPVAIETSGTQWALQYYWTQDSPPPAPAALVEPVGQQTAPLAGNHPVLAHTVCTDAGTSDDFFVVQSVLTTNAVLDTSDIEYVQRFQVPLDCSLRWVELAFPVTNITGSGYGQISIYDANGQNEPPIVYPQPLMTAGIYASTGGVATWQTHFDLLDYPTLEAGHDYWLSFVNGKHFNIHAKELSGFESSDFTSRIGPLYRRHAVGDAAEAIPSAAMSFRMIGVVDAAVGVPAPPPPARASLQLAIGPNPSRGATLVRWEHAAGALRIDVLDARGRRVAHAATAPGARGSWSWNGTDDAGHALPAAVYFVRATDDADRVATGRIVLVR